MKKRIENFSHAFWKINLREKRPRIARIPDNKAAPDFNLNGVAVQTTLANRFLIGSRTVNSYGVETREETSSWRSFYISHQCSLFKYLKKDDETPDKIVQSVVSDLIVSDVNQGESKEKRRIMGPSHRVWNWKHIFRVELGISVANLRGIWRWSDNEL